MSLWFSLLIGLCSALSWAAMERYDYGTFLDDIEGTKTVGGALHELPKSIRKSYTLMREAEGAQKSDPKHPRAVLFNEDATFIVTFTDASKKGGERLEVAQFDLETDELAFFIVDYSRGFMDPSEANPSQCLSCHAPSDGDSPKHFWTQYRFWKGAYGENDDGIVKGSKEYLNLVAFYKAVEDKKHPRYSALIWEPETVDTLFPFYLATPRPPPGGGPDALDLLTQDKGVKYPSPVPKEPPVLTGKKRNSHYMPNIRLAKLLNRLNARRVARMFRAQRVLYPQLEALIASQLLDCGVSYWTKEQFIQVKKKLLAFGLARGVRLPKVWRPTAMVAFISQVLGVSPTEDWSIERHPETSSGMNYSDGSVRSRALVAWEVWKRFAGKNPKVLMAVKSLQEPQVGLLRANVVRPPHDKILDSISIPLKSAFSGRRVDGLAVCQFAAGETLRQMKVQPKKK